MCCSDTCDFYIPLVFVNPGDMRTQWEVGGEGVRVLGLDSCFALS